MRKKSITGQFFGQILTPLNGAIWALSSVIIAYIGPFGTYLTQPLAERIVYWSAVLAAAIALGIATQMTVRHFRPAAGHWVVAFLSGVMFTCIFTPVVHAANLVLIGDDYSARLYFFEIAGIVLLVPVILNLVAWHMQSSAQTPASPPHFLKRLSPELGGHLLRITVQDHYVEAHTAIGSEVILMRFSDALAELAQIDGLQVHRSHWVARGAITGSMIEAGRMFLLLSDGARIPVSRGFRHAVDEAGLPA